MANTRGSLSNHLTWVLAVSVIFIAILVGRGSTTDQPLAAVFVFAGFLATRLPFAQFMALVLLITLTLMAPLLFVDSVSTTLGSERLWQRLIGLSCLGGMTLYQAVSFWNTRRAQSPTPLSREDITKYYDSGVPGSTDHDLCDRDSYHPPLLDSEWMSGGESTTRLRQSVGTETQDPDSLSMDVIPAHDRFQPILDELETCNAFSKDQILAVGDALRSLDISQKNNGISPLVLFQGQRVGSFKVQTPLGRGGEGTIYRGSDEHGNTAAIKILHNMRVSDRFRREMQMVRELAHRNIVTAYEVGEFQGLPFIAMELLEGPDLNQQVKQHGELDWRTTTKYVMQIAHALSHAHQRDLVHRDVKPANIILDGHGGVKLVDLGLASKAPNEDGLHSVFQFVTQEGQLAGTLPFMAPEQAKALMNAKQQSDIYSLGASWFYLLTARGRLQGKSFEEQMRNLIINRSFNDLDSILLPERLMRIYRRMTAYNIDDRYSDCEQLIGELSNALVELGEELVLSNDVNVLVVEDSKADMILTLNLVHRANPSVMIHQAASLAEAFPICREKPIDMVLLDLTLPDSTGIDTVVRFREQCKEVPLAVLTGLSEEQASSESLMAGADTFISKEELSARRMERIIFITLSRCGAANRPATL